jgi:hypothetical protein
MRNLHELDAFRIRGKTAIEIYGSEGDGYAGAFIVPSPADRQPLVVVAAADAGWDHVSVSRRNRCPNWAEMEHIARLFFREDEVAMQLHVPASEHINIHPNVLHWWRPWNQAIPRPPAIFV